MSVTDIGALNRYWALNPNVERPVSQIITGPSTSIPFRATGIGPVDVNLGRRKN